MEAEITNYQYILALVGALIAIITLILGVLEYRKKNMLERIELYLKMRDYYARDENLKKVCSALGDGEILIESLTYEQKRQFLGTMESVALLVNSNVMNKHVAMYMFGFYVISAWESENFWAHGNLKKDDTMWYLYKKFYNQNVEIRNKYREDPEYYTKKYLNFLPKYMNLFVLVLFLFK